MKGERTHDHPWRRDGGIALAALLAIVVLCNGCSWIWRDAHSARYGGRQPTSAADCPSYVWAGIDTAATATLAYLTTVAVIHRNDADSAANIFALPLGGFALLYATSVAYGLWMPGHCKRQFDQPRPNEQVTRSGPAPTPRR